MLVNIYSLKTNDIQYLLCNLYNKYKLMGFNSKWSKWLEYMWDHEFYSRPVSKIPEGSIRHP